MKRIALIGSGGAGKSTAARRLGELLGIEVVHLDQMYWKPGWVKTPEEEWIPLVQRLLQGESWIMDGNFGSTMNIRLQAADTIVLLDLPRAVCTWRVLKRVLTHWKRVRPDMAPGCPDKLDFTFIKWVWDYPKNSRPRVLARIAQVQTDKRIVHIRKQSDLEKFLQEIAAAKTVP